MAKLYKTNPAIGYVLGFLIFALAIPSLIYFMSVIGDGYIDATLDDIIPFRAFIAPVLFTFGLVFVIWSNIDLVKTGKGGPTDLFNVNISPRTKKLVTSGPYHWTRNPMVLGMNTIYFSFAYFLNSPASLIFCITFLLSVIIYLKITEEQRLINDFGDEYMDYKKKVPMIFPFPKHLFF